MSTDYRIYIVSFGNSRKYKLDYDAAHGRQLADIERELNQYLASRFPDQPFSYYTSPRVDEVSREDYDKVKDYPELDDKAIDEIKKVLVREINDMDDLKMLNRNAPFDLDARGG